MRLCAPGVLLLLAAVWLALFGDGIVFGVVALSALGVAMLVQVRDEYRELLARRRRQRRR